MMKRTIAQVLAAAQLEPVEARALLRHALGVDDTFLISHSTQVLSDAQSGFFAALAARRGAGEPVAYIIGRREFFSLEFNVTPAVLIPRPETELLVEFALEKTPADDERDILDLGTGSGCIAVSIAKHRPRARVVAVDLSVAALAVARENAELLLESPQKTPSPLTGEGWDGGEEVNQGRVQFMRSDWFSALAGRRFDVILANPPYVVAGDPHLERGDLRFEPAAALVGGADGLDCIRSIVASAPQHLSSSGWLAFEHGYDQAVRCHRLLADAGYDELFARTDLAGIKRVSGGRWPR